MKKILYAFLLVCPLLFISSCEENTPGCTYSWAENYNAEANDNDGSCFLNGCTDPSAQNYIYNATIDDGSCQYVSETNAYIIYNEETYNLDGVSFIEWGSESDQIYIGAYSLGCHEEFNLNDFNDDCTFGHYFIVRLNKTSSNQDISSSSGIYPMTDYNDSNEPGTSQGLIVIEYNIETNVNTFINGWGAEGYTGNTVFTYNDDNSIELDCSATNQNPSYSYNLYYSGFLDTIVDSDNFISILNNSN